MIVNLLTTTRSWHIKLLFSFTCILLTIDQSKWLSHAEDSFPDIFQHLTGKDRFRFYYELSWFDTDHHKKQSPVFTKLVEESFSFELNAGRLLLNDGKTPAQESDYGIFYWFGGSQLQEAFWLRPFICLSGQKAADAEATESWILPYSSACWQMFGYTGYLERTKQYYQLQGLAALMANVAKNHKNNLKRVEESAGDDRYEQQVVVSWLLNSKLGYWLKFSFDKSNEEEELDLERHLRGLRISIYKSQPEGDSSSNSTSNKPAMGPLMAQWTVLKASYWFPDYTLQLPLGYSCHRSGKNQPISLSSSPLFIGPLTRYSLQVTVTNDTGRFQQPAAETGDRLRDQFSVPQPLDSMFKPRTTTRDLTLLVDRPDNSVSLSTFGGAKLSVWQLGPRRKYAIDKSLGSCEGPESFLSSLQLQSSAALDRPAGSGTGEPQCEDEEIELELGDDLGLRVNEHGLRWLTFELQDRGNQRQLAGVRHLDPEESQNEQVGGYEVSYESFARQFNLCLFRLSSREPIATLKSARLITKFSYSLVGTNQWRPLSSSLMFYDDQWQRLLYQVKLQLIHMAPYEPWASSRHLLADLSACNSGPRQAASLWLEYPLAKLERSELLAPWVSNPHQLIREAIYSHLRSNYQLQLARVPNIEVLISSESVAAEIRLLERAPLLEDSRRIPAANESVTWASYAQWLRQATRSALKGSLQTCASYCQQYRCQVYVYCQDTATCYIYLQQQSDSNATSFLSVEAACSTYRVSSERFTASQKEATRSMKQGTGSWSLEDVLESLQQSVAMANSLNGSAVGRWWPDARREGKNEDPLDKMVANQAKNAPASPVLKMSLSQTKDYGSSDLLQRQRAAKLIRLTPYHAHYAYDNPNPSIVDSSMSDGPKELTNFQVALSGFRLVEVASLSNDNKDEFAKVNQHHWQHLDLDHAKWGYLSLDRQGSEDDFYSIYECQRLCLVDAACSTFSYCSSAGKSRCLISRLNQTGIEWLLKGANGSDTILLRRLRLEEDPYCTILRRSYSDQFERMELKPLSNLDNQPMNEVLSLEAASSAEECASGCFKGQLYHLKGNEQSPGPCLSFDFCRPLEAPEDEVTSGGCILYNRHLVGNSNSRKDEYMDPVAHEKVTSRVDSEEGKLPFRIKQELGLDIETGECRHFVRNYLFDFHKISGRRLPPEMRSLTLKNYGDDGGSEESTQMQDDDETSSIRRRADIPLAGCARLCEEDPNCGAFEYCSAVSGESPHQLLMSCSLGSNETLGMMPGTGSGRRQSKSYVRDMLQLGRSELCSVYAYRSVSLVAGHKKKNLRNLMSGESANWSYEEEEKISKSPGEGLSLLRLDLLLTGVFFLIGFLARVVDLNQFGFRRLTSVPDSSLLLPPVEQDIYPATSHRWPQVATTSSFELDTMSKT